MHKRWLAYGACVLLVATGAGAETPPAPDKVAPKAPTEDDAKARFLRGKELYAQGDFDGAIREWQAAHERAPKPELLFNIARACEQAGRTEDAIRNYRRYLDEAKDPPDRPSVEATIARLQEQQDARASKEGEARKQEQAAEHLRKGRELYQASRYADALKELQAAFELVPSATLVYNMAKTRERLGDLRGALGDYRRYLEMEPRAPDRSDVDFVIKALEKKLGQSINELALESSPPGAEVYLDDGTALAGQTPLTLRVVAGPHKLRVVRNGFEPAVRDFTMPEDRPLTLTFDLRPLENVGWLSVDCDQEGSHIFLDGTILALTPYRDRRALPAGRHQVVLERTGYERFVQVVDVKQGKETHVRVRLQSAGGRSVLPLVLAPLLGTPLVLAGAAAGGLSGALFYRARSVIDGTPAWQRALGGMGAAAAAAVVLVLTGAGVCGGIVGLWVALGLVGRSGSDVSVRPGPATAETAPAPTAKPPAPAGGAP
ncbi:MAG: PEGA domain-containing protein [Deltaproteobacteria bacterium]|nr:PEGA domain-containing protein [Deltaproteobacteria bacterium]